MEEVAAVLFDFDGVLADSVQVHGEAWRVTYRHILQKEMPLFTHGELAGKSTAAIGQFLADYEGRPNMGEALAEHKLDVLLSGTTCIGIS